MAEISKNTTIELMEKIGLDERESQVYLTLLEYGPLSASLIARKTNLGRTYIYDIAEDLKEKGLISETEHQKMKTFVAEPPERLVTYLENRKSQIEKYKGQLSTILPTLVALHQPSAVLPKIKFYEGREGIKAIYGDTLKGKHKEILQSVSVKDILESPGKTFMSKYIKRRAQLNIKAKAIHDIEGYAGDKKTGYNSVTSKEFLREVRYPKRKVDFTAMIMIYGDKVAMMSTQKENFGFIVESREFTNTMREYFEAMWQTSTPTTPC